MKSRSLGTVAGAVWSANVGEQPGASMSAGLLVADRAMSANGPSLLLSVRAGSKPESLDAGYPMQRKSAGSLLMSNDLDQARRIGQDY